VCIFTSEIENYSRSRQPYLGITVYIGKHKTEFKHLKTPGTWRMDFSELKNGSSRAAAYNEKSGRITSLLFPKISAQIFPPWRKGNIEAKCLPPPQVLRCVTAWHWGPSACITKETASGAVGRQQPH